MSLFKKANHATSSALTTATAIIEETSKLAPIVGNIADAACVASNLLLIIASEAEAEVQSWASTNAQLRTRLRTYEGVREAASNAQIILMGYDATNFSSIELSVPIITQCLTTMRHHRALWHVLHVTLELDEAEPYRGVKIAELGKDAQKLVPKPKPSDT